MRAIKIDAKKKEIYEVYYNGTLEALHKFTNSDCICAVPVQLGSNIIIYVDDEGLFKRGNGAFKIKNFAQPLAGSGLICCINPQTGKDIECNVSIEFFKSIITFIDESELPEIK